ncbi:uncharacterized protein ACR2FA_001184 [Aphomia sociella]
MNIIKYLSVLVVFCLENGETGGHGEKHHDHVRIHMPEFIHHDHHTKVITIHHHHHKPKKEHHHHHHHHHHKPHVPHVPHYHHHHKKLHVTTKTVSKGHGHKSHHGHHGHHSHHGHHGHHGHHTHHGHHGHHHHDPVAYDPPSTTFEEDFDSSFTPSVPSYGGISQSPQYQGITPQVHGITHTVKQVKVFDSLPGAIPSNSNSNPSHGYEVTEADEDDDDAFTSINSLQESYPGTYAFVRGADAPTHDPFAQLSPQTALQTHDPFATGPEPTSALGDVETFTGSVQQAPFASSAPTQSISIPTSISAEPSAEYPATYSTDQSGFDSPQNSFIGPTGETAFLSNNDNGISDDTPVSFSRSSGIQETVKTGGVETIVY